MPRLRPLHLRHHDHRPGPWRVLEVFTWTMMISIVAAQRGWEAGQPVTLPAFDILTTSGRRDAEDYIARFDPDLLAVAWPCTVWSPLQNLGPNTVERWRRLHLRRQEQRCLLRWMEKVVRAHRSRCGFTFGENPASSKAWAEPSVIAAFEGLPKAVTHMCQFGLCRPSDEFVRLRHRLFLKKPTMLAADEAILRRAVRLCPGIDGHVPVLGGVKHKGRWIRLSEFAGGYTKCFSLAVVRGAEDALAMQDRKPVQFVPGPFLPEETFVEDDAEILEEAPVTAVPPSEDDGGDDERRLKKQRSEGASESESMEGETSLEHRRQLQDLLEEAGQAEGEDGRAEAVDVGERGSRLERLHLVH